MKKTLLSLILSCLAFPVSAQVTGAGATFPYPVYSKWATDFKKETGVSINYQSIGSGAGIKQIQLKTVTFGATDMPLSNEELEKFGLVQFPMVTGSVVLVHSLKQNDIKLTSKQISDIYLGNLKKVNNETILPIRRSDGSGTTYLFTKWLSSEDAEFKDKIGVGSSVSWPSGIGAKGNEGVTNNIKLSKNSIGYVEYAYARQNGLSMLDIVVNDKVISPNMDTFKNNQWPLTAPSYILMYKSPVNAEQTKLALAFFTWVMKNGDRTAEDLFYIPLSKEQKFENLKLFELIR